MADEGPLACPRCARKFPLSERFCDDCQMPLVYAGTREQAPITEAHEKARKVKPQYVGGELVRVAGGRNLAETELIQGMLLEEGIPSMQRRSRGADVPDFLAGGRRDIMVPQAGYEAAHQLLSDAEEAGLPGPEPMHANGGLNSGQHPLNLFLGIVAAFATAFVIVYLLYELAS